MYICYIDEAGCPGALPTADTSIQPVFVLGGVFLAQSIILPLTHDLLHLKQRFFPGIVPEATPYNDWIAVEIKGSTLKRLARSGNRNDRRFAYMVIGKALEILEKYDAKLVGRVYVKPVGGNFNGTAVYSSSVQWICTSFQHFLISKNANGLVIADSRNKPKNTNIAHSIFTQRLRASGDPYSQLVELPTFSHSDNHAGLQFMDLICSTLLFPISAQICSASHLTDHTHCDPRYLGLRERFGQRVKCLQYRYHDGGKWSGGIKLIDPLNGFAAPTLFG